MAVVFAVLVLTAAATADVAWSQCVQLTPCSCRGPQGVVDLSPLVQHFSQVPRFKDVVSTDPRQAQFVYSYSPCYPFTEADSTGTHICSNVAVCQLTSDKQASFSLGAQSSAKFLTVPGSGLVIGYQATSDIHKTRVVKVSLVCDPATEARFTVLGELPPGSMQYFFKLTSKYACPKPDWTTLPPPPPPPPATPTSSIWSMETMTIIDGCILLCIIILIAMVFLIYKKKHRAPLSYEPPAYNSHVFAEKKSSP